MEFPMTIAYNMEDKKVGCVLMQPIFGTSCTGSIVSRHFSTKAWDLSPTKLKVYTIKNQEEFDRIVELTNKAHETNKT